MIQEKEELQKLVKECNSFADILIKQGKSVSGAAINILKEKLGTYHIPYFFMNKYDDRHQKSLEEILVEGTKYHSPSLKKRLIKAGFKQNVCEICGQIPEWNGKPLTLQLDHVNGNHTDNRLENLRIVCPNCHTQTNTWGSKKKKVIKYCCDCGVEILSKSIRCRRCSANYNRTCLSRKDKPSKSELFQLICNQSFTSIGKLYHVSDNTIRKWCKRYKLPYKKQDIKKLLNK